MNPTTANKLATASVVLAFFVVLFFLATLHFDPMPKRVAWVGLLLSLATIATALPAYLHYRKN